MTYTFITSWLAGWGEQGWWWLQTSECQQVPGGGGGIRSWGGGGGCGQLTSNKTVSVQWLAQKHNAGARQEFLYRWQWPTWWHWQVQSRQPRCRSGQHPQEKRMELRGPLLHRPVLVAGQPESHQRPILHEGRSRGAQSENELQQNLGGSGPQYDNRHPHPYSRQLHIQCRWPLFRLVT